jgi:hypothetical protein
VVVLDVPEAAQNRPPLKVLLSSRQPARRRALLQHGVVPMTLTADEHDRLRLLEESLWRAETRFDHDYMDQILAPDFLEFGRSGRVYRREDVFDAPPEPIHAALPLANFAVRTITGDVALVTYVSEVTYGEVKEVANRSSLWSRHAGGWRIRFHQGTPT